MAVQELVFSRLGRTPEVPGSSDEAVVDAFAANLDLGREQMHRIVTRDPEELADADLVALGCTREEAVAFAREVRSGLGPAYRRVLASSRRSHDGGVTLAAARVGTRARGAGRPGARRSRSVSSSPGGDDGSGSDPEPSSRPARRWALYRQSQPLGGRQRAVIVPLDGAATGRAEL
jgi:hypothetical protein